MPRYAVSGVPPEAADLGSSAYTPNLTRMAASGAYAYKLLVRGYPGNREQPIQFMDSTRPSPDLGDEALAGTAKSTDAPNSIWPNIYWTYPEPDYWPGAGMPVQIYDPTRPQDTTMIPVPAEDYRQTYGMKAATLAMGVNNDRKNTVKQGIRQLIKWPGRNQGNGIPVG